MTHPHSVSRLRSFVCVLFAALSLVPAAIGQSLPYLFESAAGSGPPTKIVWQTEPGVRYDLWQSDDLSGWSQVTGYPATATGLAMEHAFTPGPQGFFKIVPIDEQSPGVGTSYPGDGAFGVGRFAKISISLADATGIDPASIRLTVGTRGTYSVGAPELSYSGGILTFDGGGDTALGAYGETVAISLTVADMLGNSGVYQWTFQLEVQPQLAASLFVFGSPAALRAGQQVGAIPTRALIPGPIRMDGPTDPWTIQTVAADRIVLAYTADTAPVFAVGTYLCNRTPATLAEIFYRKVTSVSDDAPNKKLTLFTQDVGLQEIITDGAFSTADDGLVFEVGGDGTIVRAIAGAADVSLGDLGYSLDGTTFALERQDGLDLLSVEFEQLHWWLRNSRFHASIDLGWTDGLRRMEGVFSGDLDSAMIFNADVALLGQALEDEIFDLPAASEPSLLVPLGPFAFAQVKLDLKLRAEASAAALLSFRAGYKQHGRIGGLGCRYDKPDFTWINDVTFSPTEVEPLSTQISGNLSLKLKLEPSVSFLVYGLAGAELALEPSGGVVFETDPQNVLTGRLEAGVDVKLTPGGPALEWIRPQPSLSRTLWETRWPLFSNQPVAVAPVIVTQPRDVVANIGGSARFSCAVNRTDGATWQWEHNGVALPGQTKSYLDLTNVTTGHAGGYAVRIKAGGTSLQSATATLTVLNNLADEAEWFQYPIGDRQWKAEFPDYPAVSERNTLYPDNPALDQSTRTGKGAASGWYNFQDTGSYLPAMGGLHGGEDWHKAGVDTGEPVYPVAKGTVVKISQASTSSILSWGWTVVVEHRLAAALRKAGDADTYYSIYTHISPHANGSLLESSADKALFAYQVGDSVSMNHPLGSIGAIEAQNTSPHLHLEIRKKVREINNGASLYLAHSPGGYASVSGGAAAAFANMQSEGIVDPSDFIDDHGAVTHNPVSDSFAYIPAGSFEMGQTGIVTPVHSVYVSAFYMGRTKVTWLDWRTVRDWARASGRGYTDLWDGSGKADNHPVQSISWYQMVRWCNAKSEMAGLTPCYTLAESVYRTTDNSAVVCNWTANGYRLPTEAEWEKAARGGVSGALFPWGTNTISHSQANYCVYSVNGTTNYFSYDVTPRPGYTTNWYYHPTYAVNGEPYTSPVGSFAKNGYGLYDMAGNVWERCWDRYGTYPSTSQTDPCGATSGSDRVLRCGGCYSVAENCLVACRNCGNPTYGNSDGGFRVARGSVPSGGGSNWTVSFDSNGGSVVASQTVVDGGMATEPTNPTKLGHTFIEWCSDVELTSPFNFNTPIVADTVLHARWVLNSYTLTYTAGFGGSISGTTPQTVYCGNSGTEVAAVPGPGYRFVKWSDNSTANPRTDVDVFSNITVTAIFE